MSAAHEFCICAESYVHRLDPFAIQIGNGWGIRWYGLAYAVGFVIAWLVLRWFARTNRSPLDPQQAGDFMFAGIIGVLIGGRLGYVLFYAPHLLTDFRSSLPYWGIFAINDGGMASHGGIVGVIIACLWYAKRSNMRMAHLMDMGTLACAPGLFLGRLANFVNGELWGRALPESMRADPPAWSVKYPTQVTDRWVLAADPTVEFDNSALLRLAEDFAIKTDGVPIESLRGDVGEAAVQKLQALEPLYATLPPIAPEMFPARVVEEAYAGNAPVIETLRPLLTPYYPSQIFQAMTDGPLLIALMLLVWWKPRKVGVPASWFLLGYGVLRVASERFRQPDEGVAELAGLSRGQVLSVFMVLTGLAMLAWCAKRDAPKQGGIVIVADGE